MIGAEVVLRLKCKLTHLHAFQRNTYPWRGLAQLD